MLKSIAIPILNALLSDYVDGSFKEKLVSFSLNGVMELKDLELKVSGFLVFLLRVSGLLPCHNTAVSSERTCMGTNALQTTVAVFPHFQALYSGPSQPGVDSCERNHW